eukprot:1142127-Pelagomonas_calceolata.AAC.5
MSFRTICKQCARSRRPAQATPPPQDHLQAVRPVKAPCTAVPLPQVVATASTVDLSVVDQDHLQAVRSVKAFYTSNATAPGSAPGLNPADPFLIG